METRLPQAYERKKPQCAAILGRYKLGVHDTLALLVERHGQLVEKDEFAQKLWPGTFVEDAALAENISRVRRALGENEGQPWIVAVAKRAIST